MNKTIYFDKCLREITVRNDLVTAILFFEVVPYHENCYAKDLKGVKTLFLDNQPINGFSGNFVTLLAILFCIGCFFYEPMKYLSIIAIIQIIYRLYSYFVFERHIEK
ncbi:hypothetical protein J5Y03_14765 [Bacillus sp. RG28]|uniref:Uncharacterized protein n=1 Tax=Gottfriedia endophytica TaxID=2820819 RepID=A0A940NRG2_9BACI|nr:hypothetical protein [Gottfriedia endophytica]MBP0726420.1 hypothetical protein [Gottfriedia endophytica]